MRDRPTGRGPTQAHHETNPGPERQTTQDPSGQRRQNAKNPRHVYRELLRRGLCVRQKRPESLSIPVQEGRTPHYPYTGLQAVKQGRRVCGRGTCRQPYVTENVWVLVL